MGTPKSPRYWIHRNVFLRWGGKSDQAFVQLGEDGVDFAEISDALIENNLMLGDSPASMAAPVQLKGAENVTVRANTVVGDLPSGAYGLRIGTEGSNPPVSGYFVRGNIFADPTGSMGNRLVNLYGQASGVELDHNLFFNAGAPLPSQGGALPSDDADALTADPLLPTDQAGIVLPEWQSGGFPSGSATIRDELLRLVESYGALSAGSPAIDSGDPANMPADDIRGLARDGSPDRGAYEFGAATPAPDAGVGGSGSGGAPGSGGSATGGGPGSGGAVAGSGASDSGDDGGCGCRTAGGDHALGFGLLLALGLLLGARRRYSEQ